MKSEKESEGSIKEDNENRGLRLVKLVVTNFRAIGKKPVEIDLDDIVVLVGPNNAGKSSILKAYDIVMSEGKKTGELTINDFPNRQIDPDNLPTIEVHTIFVSDKSKAKVGDKWLSPLGNGEELLRERWIWSDIGKPRRQGWDVKATEWADEGKPSGAAAVANSRRPEPHRVDAFGSPDEQAKEIIKIIKDALKERVKGHKEKEDDDSEYKKLVKAIGRLQQNILVESQDEINNVNFELTKLVRQVFPNYKIDFDIHPEDNLDIDFFKSDPQLLMGVEGEYMSSLDKQGSGARRTLLWAALKYVAENVKKPKTGETVRSHILLLDEPEICLHPSAIREACKALYELPSAGNWQVMITTHSPTFIDFSKDNTTVIRVDREKQGDVRATTVYRPSNIKLDDSDKMNLKLLNLCDPYVAEFLFGGKIVIIEGDTEYTAFNYVISKQPYEYRNVHLIRARGKATIVSLVKILNNFNSNYSILHDSDVPMSKNGNVNPAWTNNQKIIDEVNKKSSKATVRLLASQPNFEEAYFGTSYSTEKPYKALSVIMNDEEKYNMIKALLSTLVDPTKPVPPNCIEWFNIEDLKVKEDEE